MQKTTEQTAEFIKKSGNGSYPKRLHLDERKETKKMMFV